MRKLWLCIAFSLISMPAMAVEFQFDGYADFRAIAPAGEKSWLEGGLGKLRYGKGDGTFQFAEAVGEAKIMLAPDLVVVSVARIEPRQRTFLDLTEAYIRYRPVSLSPWRWSIKLGAFFPPFSLENTDVGWTSYWTLTPSAINSWFGDELRTIGGEGTMEWRGEAGTLTASAAAFGWNDPAGVMIADRGWSLDDRPTGLVDHLREPDATLILFGDTPPDHTPIFKEFDHRVGWYAGVSWDDRRNWHVETEYYDNAANASAHSEDYFAWRTRFWNVGFSAHMDEFTTIAQAISGTTTISPFPGFSANTDFSSAFLLLGWERGDWRAALRGETFMTQATTTFGPSILDENGNAVTAAVSWLPNDWVRLTAELVDVQSTRRERVVVGLSPDQTDRLFQLSARFYLDQI